MHDETPFSAHTIDVDVINDRDGSVAAVTFRMDGTYDGGKTTTRTGMSKRKPGDKPNKRAGEQLAIGRALVKLGQDFQRAAVS